jgi:Secretion system C-terminal sorting domain
MKKLPMVSGVFILFLFNVKEVSGQLTITPGAQLSITGSLQLTLSNSDLVNNGSFSAGTGTVSFTGSAAAAIGGSQATHFNTLQLNKSGTGNLTLQNSISIGQQINFTSGLLDLNGFDADLGTTGSLNGEQESSHIVGANGGAVVFTAMLNAPAAVNPGNLGVLISSAQNLGNTVIRRGHQQQGPGSLLRYYDIAPSNNTALNATLRLYYLDAELNGLDENSLMIWEKPVAQPWRNIGEDSRDLVANYVEQTGIAAFDSFTLTTASAPLPVLFDQFDAQCHGNSVVLNWSTAKEENSHYFSVERSSDAGPWAALGTVPAAGNSSLETAYSFVDNSPTGNDYYRIGEYDLDGKVQYTKVLSTDCNSPEAFSIWPNPVSDRLTISITAAAGEDAIIKLFDGKGALVRLQQSHLLRGSNLLGIDVKGLAAGLYYTAIIVKGRQLKLMKVIKK